MAQPVIDNDAVDQRFDYVAPTERSQPIHVHTRDEFKRLAQTLARTIPDSREKSLAFTALEESLMWANAAIARNISKEGA